MSTVKKYDVDFFSGWLRRYGIIAVIWSMLVGGALMWDLHQEKRATLNSAEVAARANIGKDLIFRKWATSHGGVYVPPTEHTPPNSYLKVPDRDVVTTTGKKLTLMNPAYMLRELQSDFADDYGARDHITSLKLLNPKNAPDPWEAAALRAFEQGMKERMEMQQIDGQPYLRMMRPLIAESGCLKCHGFQGYKVGDIRGGLSTIIPMAPFLARERELSISLALSYGSIWLIGLSGLGVSYRRDRILSVKWQKVLNDLRESEHKYHLVADYTSDWEYWSGVGGEIVYMSPSCKELTGYAAEEFLADPELLSALIYPDDREAFAAHLQAQNEQAVPGKAEFRIVRKDGGIRWISHRCRPVFDLHGVWRGIRAGNRDITERKKAEEDLRKANRALKTLTSCDEAVVHAVGESQLLQDICRILVMVGGYQLAWVGIAEQDAAKTVRPVARAGAHADYLDAVRITWDDSPLGRGPTGTAIRTGKPQIMNDMLHEAEFSPWREQAVERGYASSIAFPLSHNAEIFGALTLYAAEPFAFDETEIRLLNDLAIDLSLGLITIRARDERQKAMADLESAHRELQGKMDENSALQEQLREQAIRDPLTGLYNRRYLADTLSRELARAEREDRPISLVMADIDHFKDLNDTYGHQAGDLVLQALGELIQQQTRTDDLPCRYGGEEFLLVMPNMSLEAANERAEEMRRRCAGLRIAFGPTQLNATVSIGISSYPRNGQTVEELIFASDQALYEAKRTGRNKVCVARPMP